MRVEVSDLHLPAHPLTPGVNLDHTLTPGVTLERIFGGGGGGTCPTCTNPYALYDVSLVVDADSASASFEDFIDGQATNVYRFGCTDPTFTQHAKDTPGVRNQRVEGTPGVRNGNWEEVNVAVPTIVSQGLSGLGGHSASWSLSSDTFSDDRVRLRVSTMLPRGGRHCGEINLATGRQVNMTVPLRFSTQGVKMATEGSRRNQQVYTLRLWARSSPPGASIIVLQNTEFTDTQIDIHISNKTKAVVESVVSVDWTEVEAQVVVGLNVSTTTPIVIGMRASSHLGGTVYIDDVELVS